METQISAATNRDAPFRLPFLGDNFGPIAEIAAVVLFVVLMQMRLRLEQARARYSSLYLQAQDAGLIDD